MRVNNINSQTNFGMKDVITISVSKGLAERIARMREQILLVGLQSSDCYVEGDEFLAKVRVKIPVDLWGSVVVEDSATGTALTDPGLLDLVETASHNASQKFMSSFKFKKQ